MAEFALSRSTRIRADRATVHALLDDFREWQRWSPWEGVDPDLHREYAGPHSGVGSTYRWSGNRKAGEGQMRITSSTPSSVVVDLQFLKPFRATNVTTFTLATTDDTTPGTAATPATPGTPGATEVTEVTWSMAGRRNLVMALAGKLFFDKAIGADFEKGLASLKQTAENG